MEETAARIEGSTGTGAEPTAGTPPDHAAEHPSDEKSQPPRGRRLTQEEILRDRAVNTLLSSLRL